jgi:hypothetical protein
VAKGRRTPIRRGAAFRVSWPRFRRRSVTCRTKSCVRTLPLRWHDLETFLLHRVEHVVGPGRRVYSNAIPGHNFQASKPVGANRRNATPLRLGAATMLGNLSPLRRAKCLLRAGLRRAKCLLRAGLSLFTGFRRLSCAAPQRTVHDQNDDAYECQATTSD